MEQVLEGVLVLDLGRYIAAPLCATVLAEMGADVIHVEQPGGAEDRKMGPSAPNGDNLWHLMMNRDKRCITLDLAKPRGKEILRLLVQKADVVIESYAPAAKKKLGLTYADLSAINPRIILTNVSAFGCDGPYRDRLGFDSIAQAESGMMSLNGFRGSPDTRSALSVMDMSTGMSSALGTVLALLQRIKSGVGQEVETSLIDSAVACVAFQGVTAEFEVLNRVRPKMGNSGYGGFIDSFDAKDGMVIISGVGDPVFRRLADLIGHPELKDDPRFVGDEARWANQHLIAPLVQEWVGQRTRQEVFEATGRAHIPCGRVNTVPEVLQDPHVAARQRLIRLDVPNVGPVLHPRVPFRLSQSPGRIERAGARVGEHNDEIYAGMLGLSNDQVEELKAEGVI